MGKNVPKCVGIIMDGNRRFAKARGVPSSAGHYADFGRAKEIARHAFASGVETVIYYAFSTENWQREPEEVSYLMELFASALMDDLRILSREGVVVRFIGEKERLPAKLHTSAELLERESASGAAGTTLVIAISYGGRAEITAAVNQLLQEGKTVVTESELRSKMWSAGIADPDLIIRTGGEQRLSNFLPWQSTYSELAFVKTYWPDFDAKAFDAVLADYAERERRRGK